jgi:hypothetical protein
MKSPIPKKLPLEIRLKIIQEIHNSVPHCTIIDPAGRANPSDAIWRVVGETTNTIFERSLVTTLELRSNWGEEALVELFGTQTLFFMSKQSHLNFIMAMKGSRQCRPYIQTIGNVAYRIVIDIHPLPTIFGVLEQSRKAWKSLERLELHFIGIESSPKLKRMEGLSNEGLIKALGSWYTKFTPKSVGTKCRQLIITGAPNNTLGSWLRNIIAAVFPQIVSAVSYL